MPKTAATRSDTATSTTANAASPAAAPQASPPAASSEAIKPAPSSHELVAPSSWQQIDFISDLHLQESEPANFLAWRRYLETSTADAIFILGDLFELWVGDDLVQMETESHARTQQEGLSFESRCRRALHFCAQRMPLYFIHGNRDFLVGKSFAQSSGMRLLPDPTVLVFGGQRTLLSHGDALCLADTDYQIFRAQVRSPVWQQAFLAKPLPERLRIAQELRQQSEARKQQDHAQGKAWVDVDTHEAIRWMNASTAQDMVHGHTHEGASHPITTAQGTGQRHVLADWHAEAKPPRAQVLRMQRGDNGARVRVERLQLA
jgi:UDP-2,3-diacylglucosamine hydrolase